MAASDQKKLKSAFFKADFSIFSNRVFLGESAQTENADFSFKFSTEKKR
jgi:hypothetical protein